MTDVVVIVSETQTVQVERVSTAVQPAPQATTVERDMADTAAQTIDTPRVVNVSAVGPQGPMGPPGTDVGSAPMASYVSGHNAPLTKGMAVCVVNGLSRRATSQAPFQECVGFAFDDSTLEGISGRVQTDGNLTATVLQWDAATGMVGGLAPGQTYYLTETGAITPFPPTTLGQYLAPVGMALDATTLRIELTPTILL